MHWFRKISRATLIYKVFVNSGWPLLLLGLLLSVAVSLLPTPGMGLLGASAVLLGLSLATYGCMDLKWVRSQAMRNSHVTRQQTADFLRSSAESF